MTKAAEIVDRTKEGIPGVVIRKVVHIVFGSRTENSSRGKFSFYYFDGGGIVIRTRDRPKHHSYPPISTDPTGVLGSEDCIIPQLDGARTVFRVTISYLLIVTLSLINGYQISTLRLVRRIVG